MRQLEGALQASDNNVLIPWVQLWSWTRRFTLISWQRCHILSWPIAESEKGKPVSAGRVIPDVEHANTSIGRWANGKPRAPLFHEGPFKRHSMGLSTDCLLTRSTNNPGHSASATQAGRRGACVAGSSRPRSKAVDQCISKNAGPAFLPLPPSLALPLCTLPWLCPSIPKPATDCQDGVNDQLRGVSHDARNYHQPAASASSEELLTKPAILTRPDQLAIPSNCICFSPPRVGTERGGQGRHHGDLRVLPMTGSAGKN